MDALVVKTQKDYENFVKVIHGFSKNESVNDKERHIKILNTKQDVIGVSMANIRTLAKRVFKGGYTEFLDLSIVKSKESQTYEETLIEGLVIAQIKDQSIQMSYLEKWIPKIDNWSTCDSTTSSFKKIKMDETYFDWFYKKCFSKEEFVSRFGITILMNHYIDKCHLSKLFEMCENVKNNFYYVKMAKAWLLSYCFMKYRNETLEFLKQNTLDKFVHNKTISKCRDSFQVSFEDKELLKTLRK